MEIVADASAFLAVALNEPERTRVVEATSGATLVAPAVLPYEIGNALIAMVKRGRLSATEALEAFRVTQSVRVQLVPVNVESAMRVALQVKSYAYDAYYLECSQIRKAPLLTLDGPMQKAAKALRISLVTH